MTPAIDVHDVDSEKAGWRGIAVAALVCLALLVGIIAQAIFGWLNSSGSAGYDAIARAEAQKAIERVTKLESTVIDDERQAIRDRAEIRGLREEFSSHLRGRSIGLPAGESVIVPKRQ